MASNKVFQQVYSPSHPAKSPEGVVQAGQVTNRFSVTPAGSLKSTPRTTCRAATGPRHTTTAVTNSSAFWRENLKDLRSQERSTGSYEPVRQGCKAALGPPGSMTKRTKTPKTTSVSRLENNLSWEGREKSFRFESHALFSMWRKRLTWKYDWITILLRSSLPFFENEGSDLSPFAFDILQMSVLWDAPNPSTTILTGAIQKSKTSPSETKTRKKLL